jgi:perosamine synthetase
MQFKRRTDYLLPGLSRTDSISLLAKAPMALAGASRGDDARSRFESTWMSRFNAVDAVGFPSGRSSLTTLLKASSVGDGDEVIATGYTCMAVAEGIIASGGTPVWVDIERRSLGMDPKLLEAAITPRSRAIVIQHTFGIPAMTDDLVTIAREHGLKVIEDCCHALGSRDESGQALGGRGDGAFWSFEVSKTISSGWGGLAQDNSGDLASELRSGQILLGRIGRGAAARRLAHAGIAGFALAPSLIGTIGYMLPLLTRLRIIGDSSAYTAPDGDGRRPYGSAIADHHWAVLAHQLERLDSIIDRRTEISGRYGQVFKSHGIEFPDLWSADGVSLIRYPIPALNPDRMSEHFMRHRIPVGRWFDEVISPLPDPTIAVNYTVGQCPVGESIAAHMTNLPVHQRMSDSDVDDACGALDAYISAWPEERDFISREFAAVSA